MNLWRPMCHTIELFKWTAKSLNILKTSSSNLHTWRTSEQSVVRHDEWVIMFKPLLMYETLYNEYYLSLKCLIVLRKFNFITLSIYLKSCVIRHYECIKDTTITHYIPYQLHRKCCQLGWENFYQSCDGKSTERKFISRQNHRFSQDYFPI